MSFVIGKTSQLIFMLFLLKGRNILYLVPEFNFTHVYVQLDAKIVRLKKNNNLGKIREMVCIIIIIIILLLLLLLLF